MSDNPNDHGQQASSAHNRSPHWAHVRDKFLAKHPKCAGCGGIENLEAHHVIPFHIVVDLDRGYLELDPRNLITLCRGPKNCHLLLGHLDDFRSFFLAVRTHLPHWATLETQEAIKLEHSWQMAHLHRPRPWDYQTTDHERAAIIAFIDRHYPIFPEATT